MLQELKEAFSGLHQEVTKGEHSNMCLARDLQRINGKVDTLDESVAHALAEIKERIGWEE
jgi:hypothetical protein